MKTLSIAVKDMGRAFRSFFALAFMFGVPILMTVMFAFLFGGLGSDEEPEFTLPITDIVIVNQDEGSQTVPDFSDGISSFASLGDLFVATLQTDSFADLMNISLNDERAARLAVDSQEAGMAIIIPPSFTNVLIGQSSQQAEILFYKDPTLTMGPQVIQSVVMRIIDGFSSSSLSIDTVLSVLEENGVVLNQQQQTELFQNLNETMRSDQEGGRSNITILPPEPEIGEQDQTNPLQFILRNIMAGMMIFYAFFTGTSAAETILQEEENGTLARLFTTPTNTSTILNGKFLAGFMMIIVQVVVLLIFANLVFGINWGPVAPLIFVSIGLVTLATSFGISLMSLVKNTKQSGIVFGVVLTFTGMFGMSSVFVIGTPVEESFKYLPLLVPQGWAMSAIRASWNGNTSQAILFTIGMLVISILLFFVGNARFKKRFG
jgi:ABC-type Na+ efflux pump permease subunit